MRHTQELSGTVLGLGGAWGYAVDDLTSPARAAQAGALPDRELQAQHNVLELRIHGVSGSTGPVMLEHPATLQVAGDERTRFLRRWTPAGSGGVGIPWPAEAYSWGGLTESGLASASWLLLTPFMLFNVASFAVPRMRPADVAALHRGTSRAGALRVPRDRLHSVAQGLLRLLALGGTAQLVLAAATVLVNTYAVQAPLLRLPGWLRWYADRPTHERVLPAAFGLLLVIGVLWLVSVRTARCYEARVSQQRGHADDQWPLTEPLFWNGRELVRRQRTLHLSVAFSLVAIVLARPGRGMDGLRWGTVLAACAVLAVAVVGLGLQLSDRHTVSLSHPEQRRDRPIRRCLRVLLACSALTVLLGLCTGGWPDVVAAPPGRPSAPVVVPGLSGAILTVTVAQLMLLGVFAAVVLLLWRRSGPSPTPAGVPAPERAQLAPYARGQLATVITGLAVLLGAMTSAVVVLFATRLTGTAVPAGDLVHGAHDAAYVPSAYFAFALAPSGMLTGLVVAGVALAVTLRRNRVFFETAAPGGRSPVGEFYRSGRGVDPVSADDDPHRRNRRSVARSWAAVLLTDQAGLVASASCVGGLAALLLGLEQHYRDSGFVRPLTGHLPVELAHLPQLATLEGWGGMLLAGALVWALRRDLVSVDSRRSIGVLWDVGTFWPRAVHPFAPPCYAERAVPELVDRIRILTGTVAADLDDPAWCQILDHRQGRTRQDPGLTETPVEMLLLTGYSQGAVIAPAVIAQLPAKTRAKVSLLTLACPARRLYGRAFPAYFGTDQLDHLRDLLTETTPSGTGVTAGDPGAVVRWKNLVRHTDYIGSWVLKPLEAHGSSDRSRVTDEVDQPTWDPVTIALDRDQAPPPIHYHSGFWADLRVTQLGAYLLHPHVVDGAGRHADTGDAKRVRGAGRGPCHQQMVRHQGLEPRTR